ncbi:MAG TPA: hypothetical protein VLJ86_16645 [Ramlibacter sp.]|nr:hypothetical protein [Ramlibacter sp.]
MPITSKHSNFGTLEPMLGERMAAPKPIENDSDTAWAEFEKLQQMTMSQFGRQAEATGVRTTTAAAAFEATTAAFLPTAESSDARMPPSHALTLQDVMVEARRFNRVCPQPAAWQELYDMLPSKMTQGVRVQPAPPITGPAWDATSAMPKRMCLRDHIEWAERHGALEAVMYFLKSLAEDQWRHIAD